MPYDLSAEIPNATVDTLFRKSNDAQTHFMRTPFSSIQIKTTIPRRQRGGAASHKQDCSGVSGGIREKIVLLFGWTLLTQVW
jgi:hypothetical protein